MAGIPAETPKTSVPLPPLDAKIVTTACEYCPVACGYKAFIWPAGTEGGPGASENALGTDFPTGTFSGRWPSPNMHTNVTIDGRLQHVLVMPDPDAEVVTVAGNHSVRGGTLAQKLYRPDGPTRDRLQRPLLRVNGTLQPISWDMATDIVAELIRHVVDEHGELAMGFKVFSYEYFENTFAATKFALGAIGTPNYAPHHNTAGGTDTPGLDDTGVDAFSAGYVDYREADVPMIIGTDPYETKTVAFTQWIASGGATIIHMDPRKTVTSAYAVKNDGLHLQARPGFIPNLVVPVFFYFVLVGALEEFAGQSGIDNWQAFQLPAAIIFATQGGSAGLNMVVDIESGYFHKLLLAPANRLSILAGAMAADYLRITAQATLVLLVALATGLHFETGVPGAIVLVLLSSLWGLAYSAIGFAIALKTGNSQSTQSTWFLFMPLMFLTTLFAPKEALSGWLETAATYNPLTYLLAGMRSLSMSGWDASDLGGALLAVVGLGSVTFTLALLALRGRAQ